uniref:Uncharacterized protein n=1 Tax=Picea sitchensis TaxID=3332 RepID=A0A6B9XUZ1_PICSI|nr:hypothetical protein Q903MT_gene3838 [Picea sitchensis]
MDRAGDTSSVKKTSSSASSTYFSDSEVGDPFSNGPTSKAPLSSVPSGRHNTIESLRRGNSTLLAGETSTDGLIRLN